MAKISQYPDAGAPTSTDKIVIARSGRNWSLLWSAILTAIGSGSSGAGSPKYIITPSISSNNLTIAMKYLDGSDPTSTNKLVFRVGNTEYELTSALSFTKNAGTNWANAGSSELAAQNIQWFMYAIGETGASAGLKFGFSRIPYADKMGDFVNTTTDERYILGNWTNFNSTDDVSLIGRFNAQLSASASYNWSIGTALVVNYPIDKTDWLSWTPTRTGFSVVPTSIVYQYKLVHDTCFILCRDGADGTSNANTNQLTLPIGATQTSNLAYQFIAASNNNSVALTTPSYGAIFTPNWSTLIFGLDMSFNSTAWATSNNKRIRTSTGFYKIG